MLRATSNYANESGLLPEQVWDADDIPEKGLYVGRPTGAAALLLWAHAEYLKLRRSLEDGRVFDRPTQTSARFSGGRRPDARAVWRAEHSIRRVSPGTTLRIEATDGAEVTWSVHDETGGTLPTDPAFLGVRIADLEMDALPAGAEFRIVVPESYRAERKEYVVEVR